MVPGPVPGRQIVVDLSQGGQKGGRFLIVEPGHGLCPDFGRGLVDGNQLGRGIGGQEYPIGPAIVGVRPALDQTGLFQLIDQTGERDRLYFDQLRQLDLTDSLVTRDVKQRTRLGKRQIGVLLLLKGTPHQTGCRGQQEAQILLVCFQCR